MYLKFVLFSAILERANRIFAIGRRLQSFELAARLRTIESVISGWPLAAFAVALVALAFGFEALLAHARALDATAPPAAGLPYAFVYVRDPLWPAAYAHVAFPLFLDACAQSIVLAALFVRTRARPPRRADLAVTAAAVLALLACGLGAGTLESTDLYSYVANARLGMTASYGTHITIADPALRAVTHLTWGTLPPSPYGPLWQWYDRIVADVPSLAEAALRLRLFNAGVLVVLIVGLVIARVPLGSIALVAFNPYLYHQFVANAHNDLLPIAALVLAAAFARRSIWAPVLATIAAGLIKLPLCLVGLATLAIVRSTWRRLALAAAIVATVGVLSFAIGGRPYLAALLDVTGHAATADRTYALLHGLVIALALGSLAYALVTRHRAWPASLGIPTVGAYFYPWYLAWLVPLAFARRDAIAPIAIAFPVVGLLLSDVLFTTRAEGIVAYAIFACATVALAQRERTPMRKRRLLAGTSAA